MGEQLTMQRPGRLLLSNGAPVAQQIGEPVLAPLCLRQLLSQGGLQLPACRFACLVGDGVGAEKAPERPDSRRQLPQHRREAPAGLPVAERAVVEPGFVHD